MQKTTQIGSVNWTTNDIKSSIPEFLELYQSKPIKDNEEGMGSPHMFATWFMLKKLNPAYVSESGIWKGQGTWLMEKTLPEAKIFSTVLFFDDHQNAFEKIKLGKELGFKQFIFEDNYPKKQGDCYPLKKVFEKVGFGPQIKGNGFNSSIKRVLKRRKDGFIRPNANDAKFLEQNLSVYYEFPPVFKKDKTRWNDAWDEINYPTPALLFTEIEHAYLKIFEQEAVLYTWICYARLK